MLGFILLGADQHMSVVSELGEAWEEVFVWIIYARRRSGLPWVGSKTLRYDVR